MALKAQMEDLDKAVKTYQADLIKDNPGTLAASLVRMSMAVELPEIRKAGRHFGQCSRVLPVPRSLSGTTSTYSDERIVRVPVFANKFDEYIGKNDSASAGYHQQPGR